MKTISMYLCVLMAGFGLYLVMTSDFIVGSIMLIVGALTFLIIAPDYGAKKHPFYDHKSFMNK